MSHPSASRCCATARCPRPLPQVPHPPRPRTGEPTLDESRTPRRRRQAHPEVPSPFLRVVASFVRPGAVY